MSRIVNCPQCQAAVEWGESSPWRPFCSERCRLIDLGEWASEGYRLADNDETTPINTPPAEEG
jgi:uncharacterized protein